MVGAGPGLSQNRETATDNVLLQGGSSLFCHFLLCNASCPFLKTWPDHAIPSTTTWDTEYSVQHKRVPGTDRKGKGAGGRCPK